MERLKEAGLDPADPNFSKLAPEDAEIAAQAKQNAAVKKPKLVMTKPGVDRKISQAELVAHNKEDNPWFVVNGEVYDGTGFLSDHPGGAESITLVAGEDCSDDFMAIHSVDAKIRLAEFHIGTLIGGEDAPVVLGEVVPQVVDPNTIFLDKKKWKGAKLVSIGVSSSFSPLIKRLLTSAFPTQTTSTTTPAFTASLSTTRSSLWDFPSVNTSTLVSVVRLVRATLRLEGRQRRSWKANWCNEPTLPSRRAERRVTSTCSSRYVVSPLVSPPLLLTSSLSK
jgi:cytochrome b involved in lipid metabolism